MVRLLGALLALPLLLALAACGSDADAGGPASITVADAWSRATPSVATTGVVYAAVTNGGGVDARLVGVSVPSSIAAQASLHETRTGDGASDSMPAGSDTGSMGAMPEMAMVPVDAIDLPAGETVSLAPGGYHVMLEGLARPLAAGEHFDLELRFDGAPTQTVQVTVRDS